MYHLYVRIKKTEASVKSEPFFKMSEKLFKDQYFDDFTPNNELLSTIRVPKNLLYLTDRLPKPHYDSEVRRRNVS